jgi:hypothetical protein
MKKYIGFVIEEANFQSRTIIIPIDDLSDYRRQQIEIAKLTADEYNVAIFGNDDNLVHITHLFYNDIVWTYKYDVNGHKIGGIGKTISDIKPWYKLMMDMQHYGDWGFKDVDEDLNPVDILMHVDDIKFADTSICNLMGGFDHVANYNTIQKLTEWKGKPIEMECVFFVLDRHKDSGKDGDAFKLKYYDIESRI